VGLFRPSNSPAHLMGLIRARLERLRISSPVSAVHLEVTAAAISDTRQDELFSEGSRGTGPALALLIDRLAGRLGRRAVLRVRLVPDAQPEFAYRYEPLVEEPSSRRRSRVAGVSPVLGDEHGQDAGGTRATSTGKMSVALGDKMPVASARRRSSLRGCPTGRMANLSYRDLPPRPLKLWGRPVPLAAVSIAPSGPPLRFHWQGAEQRIVTTWGPERIETGWWRGRAIGRDYYHVETATGRRYWLFRRLRDGKWFLHGAFE
jgi:protein ImuB